MKTKSLTELLCEIPESIGKITKRWHFYLTKEKGKSGKIIVTAGYCSKNCDGFMEILFKENAYLTGDIQKDEKILKNLLQCTKYRVARE